MIASGTMDAAAPPLRSCLYVGWVRHRRFGRAANAFRYRIIQPMLDLGELETVFRGRWFWSTQRPSWAWFRRADHLGDPATPLDEAVRELVVERLGRRPEGGIRLLTNPRYLGYVMNPVSFYYCDDAAGGLDAIVAEVHNTPWGERHCYVLDVAAARADRGAGAEPSGDRRARGHGTWRFEFDKTFHVSPFHPMNQRYLWRFSEPGERLLAHMENHAAAEDEGPRRPFDATLVLRRQPITGASLARTLALHPCMTGSTIARIYWQALRLATRGARFHSHPRHVASTAS